jgi:hypothetical protein
LFDKIRATRAWKELDKNAEKQKQEEKERVTDQLKAIDSVEKST